MPTLSIVIECDAYHSGGQPLSPEESQRLLAGEADEVTGGTARVSSVRSEHGVPDADFDTWAAAVFSRAVRFVEQRPATSDSEVLRVLVWVRYTGDFPIVDWPPELYAACRDRGIGLGSSWSDGTEGGHVGTG